MFFFFFLIVHLPEKIGELIIGFSLTWLLNIIIFLLVILLVSKFECLVVDTFTPHPQSLDQLLYQCRMVMVNTFYPEKNHVFLKTEIRAAETADKKHTETKLKP